MAVAATLGNATDALFGDDLDAAMLSTQEITLKGVSVDVNDAGIGDKLAPQLASAQGMDPATFRTKIAGVAEGQALVLLGSTDAARAISAAIGDFVSGKARNLTINVVAKDPAGIPAAVLEQASNDPTVLPNVADITATAQ
jgi:hypothetical protein